VSIYNELAHHNLAIDEVFRAAETYKSDFQGVQTSVGSAVPE
jgi:hypothetical protein